MGILRKKRAVYTHEQLNGFLAKAIGMVREAGLPVPDDIYPEVMVAPLWNSYGIHYGVEEYPNSVPEGYGHRIVITSSCLRNSEKSIMNTMLHEVLHTLPPEFGKGHSKEWFRAVDLINEKYGYHITQKNNHDLQKGDKALNVGLLFKNRIEGVKLNTVKEVKVLERRSLVLVIVMLFSLFNVSFAQEPVRTLPLDIPHLKFMGMPIDGSPLGCIEYLKDKGFVFREQKGSIFIMTGRFSGQENCIVSITTKENFVWKTSVSFPTQPSWNSVKAEYERYKQSYTEKYQVRPECIENLIPRFREGTGQEHWGFEDDSSHWQSVFTLPEGFITLAIKFNRTNSMLYLVVDYVDKVNYIMKEQIDMEDI